MTHMRSHIDRLSFLLPYLTRYSTTLIFFQTIDKGIHHFLGALSQTMLLHLMLITMLYFLTNREECIHKHFG